MSSGYRAKRRVNETPRAVALEVLEAVRTRDAYANLVLPKRLRDAKLSGRDAGLATELTYGTLRLQGRYDAIIASCVDRPLEELDPVVLNLLRLGAHQLLELNIPPHAAVAETVDLARQYATTGPAQLVNAVLRRISEKDLEDWLDLVTQGLPDEAAYSMAYSHPRWIAQALSDALVASGRERSDLPQVLQANNEAPLVTLCARPGMITQEQLADQAEDYLGARTAYGKLSPHSVILSGGDPGRIPAVRLGLAGVEDEGSQLVALLLAQVRLQGPEHLWLDLCAGPGGKAALLGAIAAQRGVRLLANELIEHRAELVARTTEALAKTVDIRCGDGVDLAQAQPGSADRVLVDAPCTGLGALRRRPEARWRKTPTDLGTLASSQRDLLDAGYTLLRPGGVVAYVTCSPHLGETRGVVDDFLRKNPEAELLDAASIATDIATPLGGGVFDGPYLQLWPDRDECDAMFATLIAKP
ncbi:MAG: transcription antitermination factor NusB [Actinomycetaceae bacterium]|nr:transcription antitermination factor NusB [Actinomycetaceae bacterium]